MAQADKAHKRLLKKLGREPTAAEVEAYLARKNRKRKEADNGETPSVTAGEAAAAAAAATAAAAASAIAPDEEVRLENARAVCRKPLPPPPGEALRKDSNGNLPTTITLFYQYVEPCWTKKEFKLALAKVINLGREHGITGRGRCSAEGLNCTLTASAQASRDYCNALRAWNPIFEETVRSQLELIATWPTAWSVVCAAVQYHAYACICCFLSSFAAYSCPSPAPCRFLSAS